MSFFQEQKEKFGHFIASLRLLIVNDNDLKFMWRNIVPSMDGYTHLYVNVYNMSPQKMQSQLFESQNSSALTLGSP